ncbi:MAG: type II toxin-antitoxin system VapC family toxin [Candidatus Micrarchaeota archaeon]|nr:type II toxin-antitoxin system VapC family toxin [Candidatus Micrarchaeota archaeon]
MTVRTAYLDSSAIIKRYLKEDGTEIVDDLFKQAEAKGAKLCFSIWNIGEVVGVLDRNNRRRRKVSESMSDFVNELGRLNKNGSIETIGITLPLIFSASYILVKHKLYIADALQIASCSEAKCDKFFTADRRVHEAAVKEGLDSSLIIKI